MHINPGEEKGGSCFIAGEKNDSLMLEVSDRGSRFFTTGILCDYSQVPVASFTRGD